MLDELGIIPKLYPHFFKYRTFCKSAISEINFIEKIIEGDNNMYIYEFERIQIEMSGWNPFGGNRYDSEQYRSVIRTRAENGWRYVGFFPAVQRGTGHIEEMDLIFEKETDAASRS